MHRGGSGSGHVAAVAWQSSSGGGRGASWRIIKSLHHVAVAAVVSSWPHCGGGHVFGVLLPQSWSWSQRGGWRGRLRQAQRSGACNCGVHGNAARAVTRGGQGGTCSSGVHGDTTHVVTRARQSGACGNKGMAKWHVQWAREMRGRARHRRGAHKVARVQLQGTQEVSFCTEKNTYL